MAQQADVPAAAGGLQEIVVTAQHRNENSQKIPISVDAFKGDALKAGGVTSLLDLGHAEPSLKVDFNQGIAFPFLRGMGNTAAGVVGNESSVAIYLDDMYYTRLFASILDLNDVDRVEVLKGPQGTLFGRNASGGAIQMFTKDPTDKTEGNATIGVANYATLTGQAYLATPLAKNLFWNVAVGGSDQLDGWGHSIANGRKEYYGYNWTARTKLVWEPTDTTRIKLVGYYAYQDDDFGQEHDILKGTVAGTTNLTGSVANPPTEYSSPVKVYPSLADSGGFYNERDGFRPEAKFATYGATLRVDQQLSFADLVSITGFKNSLGVSYNQINWNSPAWFQINTGNVDQQTTQEIQFKSKAGSRINWIVGAFYMHYYAGYNPAAFQGNIEDIFVAPGTVQNIYGYQTVNSYSGFGQATVPLGDTTNLTGGIRYTDDELSGKGVTVVTTPGVGSAQSGAVSYASTSFRQPTWKAAIDHHFARDVMVYASYSRGYKAGTYNTIPLSAEAAKPEIVDAYEIGFKSEFLHRKVRLNGALFQNNIRDPQVQTVVGTPPLAASGLVNAGSARSRGFELAFTGAPVTGLELRANVTYLEAIYTDFTNGPHYEGGVPGSGSPYQVLTGSTDVNNVAVFPTNFNATGYSLPNSPRWSFDVGGRYTFDLPSGHWAADIGVSHTSRYDFGVTYQYNGLWQGPLTMLNASLNYTPASMPRFTLGVWGKNLANEHYYAYSEGNVYGYGASGWRGVAAAPRTYGGTISVKY